VISSGVIIGNPAATVSQLFINVQGPDFSFLSNGGPIGGFLPNIGSCTPCTSAVVDLGATLDSSGFMLGSGTGVVQGTTYPHVWVGFSSGTLTTPTVTLTELGESLVDVPFSFTAVMNGYLGDPFTSDLQQIFAVDLVGSGRASARFIGLVDESGANGRSFSLGSLMQYEFVQPQTTPEPGTLFLVGGAMGGLAARRALASRRRRS